MIAHLVAKAVVHEISDLGIMGISEFGDNVQMKIVKLEFCKIFRD